MGMRVKSLEPYIDLLHNFFTFTFIIIEIHRLLPWILFAGDARATAALTPVPPTLE